MTYQTGQIKQINERSYYAVGGGGITITTANVFSFYIPTNARFVSFYLVGAGGGGGGGGAGSAGTSRSGGGGGGPGSISSAIFTAKSLPSMVQIVLPAGGTGGASNSDGVSSVPALISTNILTISSSAESQFLLANGGNRGTTAGTGGTAGSASTIASNLLATRAMSALYMTNVGQGGNAPSQNKVLSTACSPGAAGGGVITATPSAGGSILTAGAANIFLTGAANTVLSKGGVTAGPIDGGCGYDSFTGTVPNNEVGWYSIGGAGGAGQDNAVGGLGGHGGIGSGGGGGGAGTTGGVGGNGGPSFCLIEWW